MKSIILFLIVCLTISSIAQTNVVIINTNGLSGVDKTNTIDSTSLEKRARFIKEYRPLRVINGDLYDFTQLFISQNSYGEEAANGRFSHWIVRGEVLQVTDDGLLVSLEDSKSTVLLKNDSTQTAKVDGSIVRKISVVCGRHQYVSVNGSKKTILAYDCGRYFNPTNDTFTNKIYVKGWGMSETLPVTAWDMQ